MQWALPLGVLEQLPQVEATAVMCVSVNTHALSGEVQASMFHRLPAAAAAPGPSGGSAAEAGTGGEPQPELMFAERVMQRSGNPYAGVNWRGVFSLPPLSLPVIAGKTYENDSPYLMFYNTIMFFGW